MNEMQNIMKHADELGALCEVAADLRRKNAADTFEAKHVGIGQVAERLTAEQWAALAALLRRLNAS